MTPSHRTAASAIERCPISDSSASRVGSAPPPLWNPDERRLITPMPLAGAGGINLARLFGPKPKA